MVEQVDHNTGLLLIVSGPSGVGKTTIARQTEQELGGVFSVSMTTRPQSGRDREGVDYHFIDRDTFEKLRDQGELLEWAEVFDQYYGTPRTPVLDLLLAGRLVILEIDVNGARQVKNQIPDALAVFIEPPSVQDLLDRLRGRRREDEAAIQRRFAKARDEIAHAKNGNVYDYFIVNDNLAKATQKVVEIVRQKWDPVKQADTSVES